MNTFKNFKRWITADTIFRANIFAAITGAVDLWVTQEVKTRALKRKWGLRALPLREERADRCF